MFDLQKKAPFLKMKLRNVDREVEPFFSAFLVVACTIMAILLFGAKSWFGGVLFLVPLGVSLFSYWDDFRK